ncbi:MAG TPA: hypothetical protein VM533_12010, partial [Fimbriiglobus sp.]|nr:hypothetical protein [Fimbriiglobus sp.]
MVVPAGNAVLDVLLELLAVLWVLEPFEHLRDTAFVRPRRDDAREVVVAARVRVHVGLHVHPAPAGRLDQFDHVLHLAPELLVGDLEVDDIHRHPRSLADRDGFLHGVEDLEPLVADVGREDAAVFLHYRA